MYLAEKIVKLREEKGWSQEELADKVNVSRQAVSWKAYFRSLKRTIVKTKKTNKKLSPVRKCTGRFFLLKTEGLRCAISRFFDFI